MVDLDFDKTMFLLAFWVNCTNLAVVVILLIVMFYLVNRNSLSPQKPLSPTVGAKLQPVKLKTSDGEFLGL